jgi:hypothetical protein
MRNGIPSRKRTAKRIASELCKIEASTELPLIKIGVPELFWNDLRIQDLVFIQEAA